MSDHDWITRTQQGEPVTFCRHCDADHTPGAAAVECFGLPFLRKAMPAPDAAAIAERWAGTLRILAEGPGEAEDETIRIASPRLAESL